MRAHTKKHPIETIELRFIGPILNMEKAIETTHPIPSPGGKPFPNTKMKTCREFACADRGVRKD